MLVESVHEFSNRLEREDTVNMEQYPAEVILVLNTTNANANTF